MKLKNIVPPPPWNFDQHCGPSNKIFGKYTKDPAPWMFNPCPYIEKTRLHLGDKWTQKNHHSKDTEKEIIRQK